MIRLLRWLIWGDGHLHKWVPYGQTTRMYDGVGPSEHNDPLPVYIQQPFQCEHCGIIRIFRLT